MSLSISADEYILPKIAERELRRFSNLRSTSSALGVKPSVSEVVALHALGISQVNILVLLIKSKHLICRFQYHALYWQLQSREKFMEVSIMRLHGETCMGLKLQWFQGISSEGSLISSLLSYSAIAKHLFIFLSCKRSSEV
jgi:hypothetical protein